MSVLGAVAAGAVVVVVTIGAVVGLVDAVAQGLGCQALGLHLTLVLLAGGFAGFHGGGA
jgi:type III secretory pathway component EscS